MTTVKNIIATLLLIIIFSLNTQKFYTKDNNTKVKSVNVPKSATNPTSTEVTLCTELSDFFNEYYNEYSIQNLQNTEQLIIVRDYKSYKRLITFEKENNIWKKDLGSGSCHW